MTEPGIEAKRTVSLRLSRDLYELVGHQALAEGLGHRPSLIVDRAIREYLLRHDMSHVRRSITVPFSQ